MELKKERGTYMVPTISAGVWVAAVDGDSVPVE
jgi:hypothetical protein